MSEYEKQHAVQAAEQAVWHQAEMVKDEALQKAKIKADAEKENALKKQRKLFDKELKVRFYVSVIIIWGFRSF